MEQMIDDHLLGFLALPNRFNSDLDSDLGCGSALFLPERNLNKLPSDVALETLGFSTSTKELSMELAVCVCVCACVRACVCMCVCMRVRTHACV